jgi:hypothetical protein
VLTAPQPPPDWRHGLVLLAFALAIILWLVLPATSGRGVPTHSLTYSKFLCSACLRSRATSASIEAWGTSENGRVAGRPCPDEGAGETVAPRRAVAARPTAGPVRGDVAADELADFCLHALAAATSLPSKAAVQRLVQVTLAGLRPPSPATERKGRETTVARLHHGRPGTRTPGMP